MVSQQESLKTCTCYCFQDGSRKRFFWKRGAIPWRAMRRRYRYVTEKVETAPGKMKKYKERGKGGKMRLPPFVFCSISHVLSQRHDQGLTLLWWQLLAAVEKTDQFGLSLRRSPAMLPMTPRNIQLLGSTEGGWRAPKETNCSFPKWGLEPSE